jgi:hypothetical protein
MSLKGEISLIRTLTDHAVWQGDLALRGAWVDLLLRANTEDAILLQRGETVTVKRGQLAWSIQNLAKKWGVCDERAAKMLAYLQRLGCIRVESSRRRTLITICNYEVYQTPAVPGSDTDADAGSDTDAVPASVPMADTRSVTGSATESVQRREIGDTHTLRARGLTPDWAEVEAFAQASGVDVPFARDWFERKVNSLTHGFATLVDWRADLLPYWRRNGAGQKNPAAREPGAVVNPRAKSLGAELMDLKRRHAALTTVIAEHPANENSAAYGTEPLTDGQLQDYRRVLGELREVEARLRSIPADAPEGWMRELRRQAFARAAEQHPGNPESAAYDPQFVTENDRLEYLALRREGAGVAA